MDWLDRSHLAGFAPPDHVGASVFEWILIEIRGGWWDRCRVLELRRGDTPVGVLGLRTPLLRPREWRAKSRIHDWRIRTKYRGASQYSRGALADIWIDETVGGRNVVEAARDIGWWGISPWNIFLTEGVSLVQDGMVTGQLVLRSRDEQLSMSARTVHPIRWRSRENPAYRIEFTGGELKAPACLALCCFAAVFLFHGGT